MNSLNNH